MHHTIELEHVSFSYPDGRQALRDVSFIITPGEKAALVGPNGAGKSTLLLHLNGILRGEGSVQVCGMKMEEADMAQIRAAVGLVFQDPDDQLFSPTVFDDVAFGPLFMGLSESEVRQRVQSALNAVGMEMMHTRTSHHLSGGEKKRVAIATVLAMQPEILVLDEPTSGLDPRSRRGLIELLRDLPQTMLISTHDLHMVQELFPRMLVIDGGMIVGDGPTQDLLSDPAFLEVHGLEKP